MDDAVKECVTDTMKYAKATLETLAEHFDATRKIILSGCEGNVTDLGDEEKDEFAEAVQYSQHAKAAIARINTTLETIS